MGGIHALRFVELFPELVAGVVLLDTPPPEFERERLELLSPGEREERAALLADGRSRAAEIVGRERDGTVADARPFARLPEATPLAVVVADSQDFGVLGDLDEHRSLWLQRSRGWLKLAVRSEWVVAEGSGHMVHHDRPGLVIDVVRRMFDAVR
jgi:pimeloyl-ACP methyl ester carboxylesterase